MTVKMRRWYESPAFEDCLRHSARVCGGVAPNLAAFFGSYAFYEIILGKKKRR